MWGRLKDRGIEQKEKGIHGCGQQCGNWEGVGGIRGLSGNGKNTIKKIKCMEDTKKFLYMLLIMLLQFC